MRYLNPEAKADDILRESRRIGLPERVIGRAADGSDIVAYRLGGTREPAVVITAGAHGDEPSGPLGALALLDELDTERITYVVPLRDPLGWNGFDRALAYALARPVDLADHDAAERLLRHEGEILVDEAGLLIVAIGELGFAFKRPAPDTIGPREIWSAMGDLLPGRPDLTQRLLGRRLLLPSNLAGIEGCGAFDRAYTVLVTPSGQPGNLNRFFGLPDQPPEVASIQALVDELEPGLVLDLHEGQGADYYVFASSNLDQRGRVLAKAMIEAVAADGHSIATLEGLASRLSPEIVARLNIDGPGILRGDLGQGDAGSSLSSYASRRSIGFTTETGRWTSLATRVQQQVIAARATIAALDSLPA